MILDKFKTESKWIEYLNHLESNVEFLDNKTIKEVNNIINKGIDNISISNFPNAQKVKISKYKNTKKRTVFIYPEPYNTYLKMINWLLMGESMYSSMFSKSSYAYQRDRSVRDAVLKISHDVKIKKYKYYIKTDFKDYFNSIDVSILIKKLRGFLHQLDSGLVSFIERLLRNDIIYKGSLLEGGNNGTMAGTPLSGYLANVYMNSIDHYIESCEVTYVRYADDVLILTDNPRFNEDVFKRAVNGQGIELNLSKTKVGLVEEGLSVLGFHFLNNKVDIDEEKADRMKNRIKRRSKWFRSWERKNKVKNETMVKTFIKGMNLKFYARDNEDRMNWSRWYFSAINTDRSLKEIDSYMVQYIRYLVSGEQLGYKKHSEVSYEYIKKLGFKPLVNEYWKYRKGGNKDDV